MRFTACLLLFAFTPNVPAVETPDYLSGPAREQFERFWDTEPHRAFALGPGGAWGLAYNHDDLENARRAALGFCREHVADCVVIAEDDRILARVNPFPREDGNETGSAEPAWFDQLSDGAAQTLAVLGLGFLVVGTLVAERRPLMVNRTTRVGRRPVRMQMNYAYVIVAFLYFMALMPTFARNVPADTGSLVAWLRFGLPILPPALAALYLQARGSLARRRTEPDPDG